jgi:hypothetical protein
MPLGALKLCHSGASWLANCSLLPGRHDEASFACLIHEQLRDNGHGYFDP